MDSRRPKRKKPSLARSFVVTMAVGIPGAAALASSSTGCSTDDPENSASSGAKPQTGVESERCTSEGEQRPCHLSLGKSPDGKLQSCFEGTQTCTGGVWSGCGGSGTVTNSVVGAGLNLAPASLAGGGIRPRAIGGTVSCGDGVCSPGVCSGGMDNNKSCLPGDCAGGKTCVPAENCTNCPTDCGLCPPGGADAGVVVCTSDPCRPDCKGWSNAPGISSAGGAAASTVIGVSGFGQIPNGQIKKLLLDNDNTGSDCDNYSAAGVPSSYYNCQVDTFCSMRALGGDGNCHQFPAGGIQGTDPKSMGSNVGFDVTMGPGCSDRESDKYRYFPICNRGTLPIPVGTIIRVKYFNPTTAFNPCPISSCTAVSGYDCSMKVGDAVAKNGSTATAGQPLNPGECQLLDTEQLGMAPGGAQCSQPNGEKWMFANCDGALTGVVETPIVPKVGAAPVGVTGAPDNEPITPPGTLGCANNWSDHSPNNNPPSCGVAGQNVVTVSSDYHAVCPIGTAPVWSKLIYDTTTPKNTSGTSEVFFEAATARDLAGVPDVFSSFYELAEAQKNNGGVAYVINGATLGRDPEKCSPTLPAVPPYTWNTCTNVGPGPAPPCCPKDIEAQLKRSVGNMPFAGADPGPGALLARQPWLRLKITIKASPDNKADAVLNSWGISYQCVPVE